MASNNQTEPLLDPMNTVAGEAALRPSTKLRPWHKPIFVAFLVAWTINGVLLLLHIDLPGPAACVEGTLLLLAAATSLLTLGRRLPLRNVWISALVIAFISSLVTLLSGLTGIPFGPIRFNPALGTIFSDNLPLVTPLIWIVFVVNSRGIARLIMRPWRKTALYGLWVIGLTALGIVILDLGLEPFAMHTRHYWVWETPDWVPAWYSAPWVNFLAWFVTAVAILFFSTPWLINRQPVKLPIDYHPVILWTLLNTYFACGNALHGLWLGAAFNAGVALLVAAYAIRGARW